MSKIIIIIFLFFLNSGCKTNRHTTSSTNQETSVNKTTEPSNKENTINKAGKNAVPIEENNTLVGDARPIPMPDKKIDTARLSVSFFSKGEGIDHRAKQKYDMFIKDYEQKKGKLLVKQEVRWGREGEIDYCYELKQLSEEDQAKFIAQIKELLKESTLVHINENVKCREWRQNR